MTRHDELIVGLDVGTTKICAIVAESRGDNLDISWLKDDDAHSAENLPEPDEIAGAIRERLSTALEEMDALSHLLEGEEVEA